MTDPRQIVPDTIIHARSDVDAKLAFLEELHLLGFTARVTASPADITAQLDGVPYYFEIKKTRHQSKYFGAATLTEWEAALDHPETYFFVTAQVVAVGWVFHQYSPAEFMAFSTIPPFKVFFDISVGADRAVSSDRATKSVRLTPERVLQMSALFRSWQEEGLGSAPRRLDDNDDRDGH